MSDRRVAVALLCFDGKHAAGKARKPLEDKARSSGDRVLQTTVLEVDAKHKASVHDPRRVLRGTLTAALTWGLFGLVAGTDKVESAVVWAVLGALCGGAYAYTSEHLLSKTELARIGRHLEPSSSALLSYVETRDAERLLSTAEASSPTVSSVAEIDDDLHARLVSDTTAHEAPVLSMLLYRFADSNAAAHAAAEMAKVQGAPQVELVIQTDTRGRRRVSDPAQGTAAWAKSDMLSWGAFGLVWGAIVGLLGGGGVLGFLDDGLVTGLAWAIFGLVAGALYGLWAGRSLSAGQLEGVGPILAPGTSALVAWTDGQDAPTPSGAQSMILRFIPVDKGAVLDAGANSVPAVASQQDVQEPAQQ